MAEHLTITITAKDGASRTFRTVADSARQLGQSLDAAGRGGQGLRAFTARERELEGELTTLGATSAAAGRVLTTAVAAPMAAGTRAAWSQVDAVQQATVALRAYETDAEAVNRVLEELVAYARSDMGVLFQRQDLFDAAQGLRVMGAETEHLVEYVEIMSRSVAVGAGTWNELGQVIGRVGSTGQLTGVEFDNLTKMGFALDESLRNTTVTWEELFRALDAGMPQVGGNVETIQGRVPRRRWAAVTLLATLPPTGFTPDAKGLRGTPGGRTLEGASLEAWLSS